MASDTECQTAPVERYSRLAGQRAANVSRPDSLRSPAEFRRVLEKGQKRRVGDLVVVKAPGQPHIARHGLVAGRRTGNAVQRNRIRRRLRAAIRLTGLPVGFDYVLLAGPGLLDVDFPTLRAWLDEAAR
jgi:ribonuclease P protein component